MLDSSYDEGSSSVLWTPFLFGNMSQHFRSGFQCIIEYSVLLPGVQCVTDKIETKIFVLYRDSNSNMNVQTSLGEGSRRPFALSCQPYSWTSILGLAYGVSV